ncbi:hypothetical protein MARA_02670 (plasmid) [Mycolicibacterium arabiense]|uniref:Uncharacterized protein n=1 Tax=Mycolicibacterium arabiense TaxID=1286181 RepID=A0A7I7RQP1_9MYCO|nr:hypothetical protein MARA_02670 [Mycolicibacterium arabiense]
MGVGGVVVVVVVVVVDVRVVDLRLDLVVVVEDLLVGAAVTLLDGELAELPGRNN